MTIFDFVFDVGQVAISSLKIAVFPHQSDSIICVVTSTFGNYINRKI